ncbi:helix-turn-helix domain-containing protein [Heyndrickxia ginsengihumi]|uniref:helix-turn-helix domain-containing protein n=1 Tax=Heyndrickxia ginsengihumi TaxID=363870 RepID=UPI0004ACEEB2|nr:helix-turn-helix transcriptional regulator [Heyndrickxia ginsengihumi]MCM3023256.1 helix-turn-helix domain-containing protein [Heyndrickxia ginsengihumi]
MVNNKKWRMMLNDNLHLYRMGAISLSTLGEKLKFYREQRGLSIEELSLKARIGKTTLENYEQNKQIPTQQTILKLSTVLDVAASVFLESVEKK